MTPWNTPIPGGFNNDWVNQERSNGLELNWLRFFFDQGDGENSKTENFKNFFYHEDQVERQQRRGANFNSLRKIAFKILTIAPNLAVSSPGNGQVPALVFGKSQQAFQAPKISIIWNPAGLRNDNNFYALVQIGDFNQFNLAQNLYTDFINTKNNNVIGQMINRAITIDEDGQIKFDQDDQNILRDSFVRILEHLNDVVDGNHVSFLDKNRPDELPLNSPIYPKLIETDPGKNQEQLIMNQNTILFGPPGTGKTYNTVSAALFALPQPDDRQALIQSLFENMLGGNFFQTTSEQRNELKSEFDSQVEMGRIVFTTFHQSYAYEDFIEGIRVHTENQQVCYEIQNGTFKQLARKALFFKASGKSQITDSFEKAADLYASTLDEELIKRMDRHDPTVETLDRDGKDLIRKLVDNDDSILELINKKSEKDTPKFVLIIDEINRGNISKILGELITLIEDNKRAGGDETATVKLPYSRENFKVPDNLYIIGTMNTSDRSLATLDIALRRRFDFIEMMPQSEFLDGINIPGIDLKRWFKELNKKIQVERGREFTIGHAFFAPLKGEQRNINALADIMRRKILPLLDEYFFEDWEGIRRVLGESEGNVHNNFIHKEKNGNETLYYWNTQALTKPQAYAKLYQYNNVAGDQDAVEE